MKTITSNFRFITAVLILSGIIFGCGQIKNLVNKENKLYFCERYDPVKGEINEAKKFTTGTLTVMIDLRPTGKKIGVKEVDINITDKSTGAVVETSPFTVDMDMDYIFFDNVKFERPGNYRVSCLKKDGTVVVSGEVEIIK